MMRYLGSKTLLLHDIRNLLPLSAENIVFCDPFGGIGTVGSYMKKQGFTIISGDLLQFAHFFQIALIELDSVPEFSMLSSQWNGDKNIEEYLNSLYVKEGWLVEEYCKKRQFFTLSNAQRIQACTDMIWGWNKEGKLSYNEYAFLIASLINSMDKVANTAGTYYAYLKTFYRKANQTFQFKLLHPVQGATGCRCFLEDANSLVRNHSCNILYLDPPYNTRNYARYYHLPETVAKGMIPVASGKSGVPQKTEGRSSYNVKAKAEDSFSDLIRQAKCEVIIFHYTDEGILSQEFVRKVLSVEGKMEEVYFDCKGYQTKGVANCSRHHIYKVIK